MIIWHYFNISQIKAWRSFCFVAVAVAVAVAVIFGATVAAVVVVVVVSEAKIGHYKIFSRNYLMLVQTLFEMTDRYLTGRN